MCLLVEDSWTFLGFVANIWVAKRPCFVLAERTKVLEDLNKQNKGGFWKIEGSKGNGVGGNQGRVSQRVQKFINAEKNKNECLKKEFGKN